MSTHDVPPSADLPSDHDVIRRMVAALAPRLPGVAERTARRALDEIPAYAVLSYEEVLEGLTRDLALAVQALVEARDFTDDERRTMSEIGDTRARQGLPLEGMLRVYRITVDEIFGELWDAVAAGELQSEEVVQLTRRVWSYAGPMMDLATAAYRDRELDLALADNERRTGLVHELLLTPSAAPHSVAASIGLDPLREYVPFRARATGGRPGPLMSQLKLPGVLEGGIVAPYEGDLIGLALRRPGLRAEEGTVIGIGPAAGLAALPSSFALATRTVETACAFGLSGVLTLDQLPLHAIARAEVELGELLHSRCVAPVLALRAGGPEVLDTVRAFLDGELSADAAATALDVHPNTVRNRLHRYEDLTGLSLRSFDALCQIRLALLHAALGDAAAAARAPSREGPGPIGSAHEREDPVHRGGHGHRRSHRGTRPDE